MTGLRRISALLISLVLMVVGASCGSSDDSGSKGSETAPTTTGAPSSSAPPSGGASADASDGASADASDGSSAAAPDDEGVATTQVSGGGLSFEVPTGFTAFDPQELMSSGADDPRFQDFLDTMGMSVEQFEQLYEYTVLFVVSKASALSGFANNINVVAIEGASPTDAQMRAQLEQIGMTVRESRPATTPAGEAQVVVYDGRIGGLDVDIQGTSIGLGVDGRAVNITISTTDAALTARLTDRVLATLELSSATS
jgi:hypothetical protein